MSSSIMKAVLLATAAVALFLAPPPASAHPYSWGDKEPTGVDPINGLDGGCFVPSGKQDEHPGAQADDGNTVFEIMASNGTLVVDFEPGKTYMWEATFPNPSESLLLASAGELSSNMSTHDDRNLCVVPGMRVTFSYPTPPTTIMGNWTAPESADVESVVFDLVRAEGSSSYFYTTKVTMCREGATSCIENGGGAPPSDSGSVTHHPSSTFAGGLIAVATLLIAALH